MKIRGDQVLLHASRIRLLVPQALVGPIRCPDRLGRAGARLAALSEDLEILHAIPGDRRLATTLAGGQVHWCWNEVRVVGKMHVVALPLPKLVSNPSSPATHFCVVQGEIAMVVDEERLGAALEVKA